METQMGRNQKRMKKPDWVAMAAGVPHQEAPSHLARSCGPPQSSLNFSQLSLKWFVTQTLWCPLKRIPPKSSKACFAFGKNLRTKITFLQRILIPVALFSSLFFLVALHRYLFKLSWLSESMRRIATEYCFPPDPVFAGLVGNIRVNYIKTKI